MTHVKSLHIYPIKGMKGCLVNSAKVMERGFENDRRFMLVDHEGTFISQRTHPKIALIKPSIENESVHVEYENQHITIPIKSNLKTKLVTQLFEHSIQATEVSHAANKWFSDILGQEVKLVKMRDEDVRHKKLIKGPKQVEVSFADGYPYLFLGTASWSNLNGQLEHPVSFDRFRANIIVETAQPHIEDSWDSLKIGGAQFMIIKPCARCQVITINQDTGTRSGEPLKTLANYRKRDNKVYFGANAIRRKDGVIRIGDEVVVL